MALIKCPECKNENVSDTATKCPHCGYNFSAYRRNQQRIRKRTQLNYFLQRRSTKVVALICVLILIGVGIFVLKQKSMYREFSGEYIVRTGYHDDSNLPNVMHFDEDGTGHYYVNMHMYLFDYTLTSTTVEIDTHEAFMPIYKAELDVLCTRTEDGFLIGKIKVEKRD